MGRKPLSFDSCTPSHPTPDEQHDALMRQAVADLMLQYGWDERTAASVMLTVTTSVRLAPKQK
jgi:hypothetical protein